MKYCDFFFFFNDGFIMVNIILRMVFVYVSVRENSIKMDDL